MIQIMHDRSNTKIKSISSSFFLTTNFYHHGQIERIKVEIKMKITLAM